MTIQFANDLVAFNRFVEEQLGSNDPPLSNGTPLSLEEGLAVFRTYQEELARFHQEIQPAIDELNAGDGTVLDMEAIIAEGRRRLAEEGILG